MAGRAEIAEDLPLVQLDAKLRENLLTLSMANQLVANAGQTYAKEIAQGVNATIEAINALAQKITEKKRNTRELLANFSIDQEEVLKSNCATILSDSYALQDSLEKIIGLVKAGKLKANLAKLQSACRSNIEFLNTLAPALARCNGLSAPPTRPTDPCNGPCASEWELRWIESACAEEMKHVFGVSTHTDPIHYKVTINIEDELWLDNGGNSFYKVYIQCDKQVIKTPSEFFVNYKGANSEIFPYSYEGGIISARQNSFIAYNNEYPMAGKVGDNLFSIASGKTDDYLFFCRVLEFCPNLVDDAQSPWKKYFTGAKGMAKTTAFAENVKTISDVTFAVVDGWYICKDIAKAVWLGWKAGGKAVVRQIWNGYDKIFKASADEIAEAATKIKNHRIAQKAGTQGNYGYLEGKIGNITKNGEMVRSGQADQNIQDIFEAVKVNTKQEIDGVGAWLRDTDSEYKMLNRLANELKAVKRQQYPKITGELKIVSERNYCPSCQGVIQQFHEMFPNVKLILIDGAK